jgi:hypothetical protein
VFATPHRPLVLVGPRSGREMICLCMQTDLLTMWVQLRSSSDKGGHRHCHRPSISTSSLHRRRHSSATTAKTGHLGARGPDGRAVGSGGPWLGRGEMNGAAPGVVDMGTARRGRGRHEGGRQAGKAGGYAYSFAWDSSRRTLQDLKPRIWSCQSTGQDGPAEGT